MTVDLSSRLLNWLRADRTGSEELELSDSGRYSDREEFDAEDRKIQ